MKFAIVIALLVSQTAAVCFNKPDGSFVADPSDQRRFYWCQNGVGIAGMCEHGQVFENGFCEDFKDPCNKKPDGFFAADTSNPRSFFYCLNGVGQHGQCPDGEFFFEGEQACYFDETTVRPTPPEPPTRPPATTRFPSHPTSPPNPCLNMPDDYFVADPANRRAFFWCRAGIAYPGECHEGEVFIEEEQYCDVAEETTRRPVVPTRPPVATTLRPGPPTRPPVTTRRTTARPQPPAVPTRATTKRVTTRRPIPSRPPPAGK